MFTETVLGTVNSVTLRNLEPTISYQIRVKSANALGSSEYSDIIEFTTDEEGKSPNEKCKFQKLTIFAILKTHSSKFAT